MKKISKEIYSFKYKNINCEIVFWVADYMKKEDYKGVYKSGGIWNSYIFLRKDKMSEEDFKKINLRTKKNSFGRINTNFFKLERDNFIEMANGISFYEKIFDGRGNLFCIKIGNDYNHIWNTDCESSDGIKRDLEETIDKLLTKIKYENPESIKNYKLKCHK